MIEGDIYSVIGNGTPMISGNGGGATSAQVGSSFVATDAGGDVLLSGDTQVRLVAGSDCSSACPFGLPSMTRGDIYAVAGTDTFGFAGDGGPATSAELRGPSQVLALDGGGDLPWIADSGNERVRAAFRIQLLIELPVRTHVDDRG